MFHLIDIPHFLLGKIDVSPYTFIMLGVRNAIRR